MTSNDELERQRFEEWFHIHWVEKVKIMSMFERHRLRNISWSAWQAAIANKQEQSDE